MSTYKMVSAVLEILLGAGCIIAGINMGSDDAWLYIFGAILIALAIWTIYKEVRDSSDEDVSEMAKQREEISKKNADGK
jgi:hypothetical protein